MLDDIKKISVEKRIDKNICFLGYQSNPLIYLAYAKVMVMTSRYEGLPMTVLEALALGIPIVSTPVDGLLNVIDEGINGYLSDSNFQIAEYICTIANDNELRSKLSYNAKKTFDSICDLTKYKNTLTEVYFR